MSKILLDDNFFGKDLKKNLEEVYSEAKTKLDALIEKDCSGSEWLGWWNYPQVKGYEVAKEIQEFKQKYDTIYDLVLVIGIGGSYLGTRAVTEALQHSYQGVVRESGKQKLFLVEGIREVQRALSGGYSLTGLYFVPEKIDSETKEIFTKVGKEVRQTPISLRLFEKLATRSNSGFIIGVFGYEGFALQGFRQVRGPLLVLDGVEKPGNIGALMRSADGAGAGGIIIVGDDYDVFSPHVIRSSLGAVFSLPIAIANLDDVWEFFSEEKYKVVAASPHSEKEYFTEDLTGRTAIVLGSEAFGISRKDKTAFVHSGSCGKGHSYSGQRWHSHRYTISLF